MATRPRQIRENLLVFIGGSILVLFCWLGVVLLGGAEVQMRSSLRPEANWVEFFITVS
jgi:hypothetical protein